MSLKPALMSHGDTVLESVKIVDFSLANPSRRSEGEGVDSAGGSPEFTCCRVESIAPEVDRVVSDSASLLQFILVAAC